MLKTRVLTAAALLAILLPILFYASPLAWALLTLVLLSAAGWEWARLSGAAIPALFGAMVMVFGLLWLALDWLGYWPMQASLAVFALAACFWIVVVPLWMYRKRNALAFRGLPLYVLLAAWLALVEARQEGIGFMLSIMLLVWLADIGAYFAGKQFGRLKLAPGISPGKTWEGVAGGLIASLLACFWLGTAVWSQPSYFGVFTRQFGVPLLVLVVILLVAMSIVGDLFESFIKRQAGVKDSSNLLPGHGGVLDRIDALLPVLPIAMLFHLWSHP
jgi:phosphatidate cytidylyltransferase